MSLAKSLKSAALLSFFIVRFVLLVFLELKQWFQMFTVISFVRLYFFPRLLTVYSLHWKAALNSAVFLSKSRRNRKFAYGNDHSNADLGILHTFS